MPEAKTPVSAFIVNFPFTLPAENKNNQINTNGVQYEKKKGAFMSYVGNKGQDQTAHLCSLIRAFVAHLQINGYHRKC